MSEAQTKKCLQYSLRLLSISPRTRIAIEKRLREKGYDKDTVKEVMKYLIETDLLNDTTYAKAFISEVATRRPCGQRRMRFDLKRKGVPENIIDETLAEVDKNTEHKMALQLAKEKAECMQEADPLKRKRRIYGFLVRRGFDFDICRDVIGRI